MKFAAPVGTYLTLSLFAYVFFDSSWLVSFLMGPSEHLSLAFKALDNGHLYLDGISRVTESNYIFSTIKVFIWVLGLLGMAIAFVKKSKPAYLILSFLWVIVGIYNIYAYAVRSV